MQQFEITFSRYVTYDAPKDQARGLRQTSYPVHFHADGIMDAVDKAKDMLFGMCQADKTSRYSIACIRDDQPHRDVAEGADLFDIFGLKGDSE